MALPSDADIPRILGDIRPGASWGWKGGSYNDPSQLDWRDSIQTLPTLQELETGWADIVALDASSGTVRQQLKAEYTPLAGLQLSALTNAQMKTLLEILVYIMGGINETTRQLKPANQWDVAKQLLKA